MENYENLVLQNKIDNAQMTEPIKEGISVIEPNPLDVVEKLGKYQFIYDLQFRNPIFDNLNLVNLTNTGIKKEGGSNDNGTYNFDGDGTVGLKNLNLSALFPQSVKVNPNSQVGNFSKGNIVNVLRFDTNNNAIIENPNYVQPDPNAPKIGLFSGLNLGLLLGDLKYQKEFYIPKNYLQKVDDSAPITTQTGINFGDNPIPQAITNYTKPTYQEPTLEENATFLLNKDFEYVSGNEITNDGVKLDSTPIFATLKAGTKVSGKLLRKKNERIYKMAFGGIAPLPYDDYLVVEGYGSTGSINIPVEYLTREIQNNSQNNSGSVVSVKNNNKNLLMIIGAFLVGYVLFNKSTPSN